MSGIPLSPHLLLDCEQKRFLAFARNDDTGNDHTRGRLGAEIPLSPSNLRPFGAPPSIGRRECPHEPLPLEGAAERSEAGLASFWGGARVLSYNRALETIVLALFHTARTLSGSLCSPPSPRGEGFISSLFFLHVSYIRFDDAGIAASSYRSLPHWEGFAGGNGILVSSSVPRKNDRL